MVTASCALYLIHNVIIIIMNDGEATQKIAEPGGEDVGDASLSKPERSPRPCAEGSPADKRHKAGVPPTPSLKAFFESQNSKTETPQAYAQHLEAEHDQELALKVKFLKAAQQYAKAHGKKNDTQCC